MVLAVQDLYLDCFLTFARGDRIARLQNSTDAGLISTGRIRCNIPHSEMAKFISL